MRRYFVQPAGLPPVNGYSHAVGFDGQMVVISGQVPLDEHGQLVGRDDAEAQARQVLTNLSTALAAAGTDLDHVVKITMFLTDLADLEACRRVRNEFISPDRPPASSAVIVSGLVNPEFRIEVEALAAVD